MSIYQFLHVFKTSNRLEPFGLQVRERRRQREAQRAEQRQKLAAEQQLRAQRALAEAEELRPVTGFVSGPVLGGPLIVR